MTIEFQTPNAAANDHSKSAEKHTAAESQEDVNPVLETSTYAYEATDLVQINDEGVRSAALHINARLESEAYSTRSWRDHALHICPPEPFDPAHPTTRPVLDWLFLISSLNFSFWSELEGKEGRYGVEWREGWNSEKRVVHTGYWSLVAAINRALEEGIPITDPAFYSSQSECPDSVIEHVFRAAAQCEETIPLLAERIAILRENGSILCKHYGGSFQGFYETFMHQTHGKGTALQLVKAVVNTFPSFRDETVYEGHKVYLWKRAQILVAETWAAFFPPSPTDPHPLFPGPQGPAMHHLTMFADYRVPQILHHLNILTYPSSLLEQLRSNTPVAHGSREEVSIRAASIVAVERVRKEMVKVYKNGGGEEISSVLIDFYLWDLAKKIEVGEDHVEGVKTNEIVCPHRTRSIWY